MRRIAVIALLSSVLLSAQDVALVPYGSVWKYLDNGSNQGTAWRGTGFNDAAWASGPAELGYGDGDEATVVSYGSNANNKYVTTYFRKTINIPSASAYSAFLLRLNRDDGAIVYINGTERMRSDMDEGTAGYTTIAYTNITGNDETLRYEQLFPTNTFQNGNNVIAVEIHQSAANSADISFDLELIGMDAVPAVHRGPCVHISTPTSVVIKWQTDAVVNARVKYGNAPGALTNNVDVATASLDHEVTVTGLQPATTYYYSIGTTTLDLAGNDANTFFKTSPPLGGSAPLRVWVIGDAGTAAPEQYDVRNAYLSHVGANKADAWFLLGDNTYFQGREAEYQRTNFNVYDGIMRNTTLWPAPGNHDYYSGASAATQTGPYYDVFAMPKNGQAGGVASNTEAYYSYDIGNVHFVALDSHDSPRWVTGSMCTWLVNDLNYAQANSEWIVAYWHHPPYCKGSHDSDDNSDPRSMEMRQNIGPILEAHGVDLVLCGHSHTYERSFLIDGHYGLSNTFNPATMGRDMSSGRADGTGAYQKPGDLAPHAGTVYTVCGVSGKRATSAPLNHPVMYLSTLSYCGSMVLDFSGTTMHAEFISSTGAVIDHFDITKAPSKVKLAVKVLLDGAYDPVAGLMRDDLRTQGLIPLAQPYSAIFTQVGEGGSETIAPAVLSTTGPDAIVDWVFVELRDKGNPTLVIDTRSALLQRDGDVVDLDGVSPLAMTVPIGNYHVAIRHRDHLACMTATPVFLNRTPLPIDLRSPATGTWGTNARRNANGTMVLWAGNCVADASIKYSGPGNDRDAVLFSIGGTIPTNTLSGYLLQDANLDGLVKYSGVANDRDIVLQSIGGTVPTNVVVEQLP